MARASRTFRVFVSSTFSDLKAERNALQRDVFPVLHRYCLSKGFRFQAIDLRWGVSEEAARDQQTITICLNEVDRCRRPPLPNFLVLLGDRYGWCPPPPRIRVTEFDDIMRALGEGSPDAAHLTEWYLLDLNAIPHERYLKPRRQLEGEDEQAEAVRWAGIEQRLREILERASQGIAIEAFDRLKYFTSATEQEIDRGALRVPDEHAFCYVRSLSIDGRPWDETPGDHFARNPHPRAKEYFDLEHDGSRDETASGRLKALKGKIAALLPSVQIRDDYEATWTGAAGGGEFPISTDHVARLCAEVYEDLRQAIDREIAAFGHMDPLTREVEAHRDFAEERAAVFVGRAVERPRIETYLRAPTGKPLVVVGEPGSGKSALMARVALDVLAADPDAAILRFVGVTPDSSTGRGLLGDLCREMARRWGPPETERPVPSEFRDLAKDFQERLALAAERRPLVLFLDALDQLATTDGARNLSWLPTQLPAGVAIVVSTTPGDVMDTLDSRLADPAGPEWRVTVSAMTRPEGRVVLEQWLADAKPQRDLRDPEQFDAVLNPFAVEGKPLFLKLAFEEARRWKSDATGNAISLPSTVEEIIEGKLFARLLLRAHHGPALVPYALGYLGAAKNGLTEDEILALLARSDEVYEDFLTHAHPDHMLTERRLPIVIWSRLFFDLEPYLSERSADGTSLLAFYHPQLDKAVERRFLTGADGRDRHREIAAFFGGQELEIEGERTLPNLRMMSELPYQQTHGELWGDVFTTLTNFDFLEKKATHAGVVDSVDADGHPTKTYTGIYQIRDDFALALNRMPGGDEAGDGDDTRRRIYVTGTNFGNGYVIRCPHCNRIIPYRPEWKGSEQRCPTGAGGCGGPWKVNDFIVPPQPRAT